MHFEDVSLSFSAAIKKKHVVKDRWVCHLNRRYRCDGETWRTCSDKRFSSRCEEPERELVWKLLYA